MAVGQRLQAVLICAIALASSANAICQRGWQLREGKCYYLTTTQVTWAAAKQACEDLDSTLAVVNDDIRDFLVEFAHVYIWIGMEYNPARNAYDWLDGTPVSPIGVSWLSPSMSSTSGCVALRTCRRLAVYNCISSRYAYVCEKPEISCNVGDAPAPENGGSNCQKSGTVVVGYTCNFFCNAGFKPLSGSTERMCQNENEMAVWGGDALSCTANTCDRSEILSPDHGTRRCSRGKRQRPIGDICDFTCNAGYVTQEGERRTNRVCQSDGTWLGGPVVCVETNINTIN